MYRRVSKGSVLAYLRVQCSTVQCSAAGYLCFSGPVFSVWSARLICEHSHSPARGGSEKMVKLQSVVIVLYLLSYTLGYDGCARTEWRCGDTCVTLGKDEENFYSGGTIRSFSLCFARTNYGTLRPVFSDNGKWFCMDRGNKCELGKVLKEGELKTRVYCGGKWQDLTEPCNGKCNYFPEDPHRGERSYRPCININTKEVTECVSELAVGDGVYQCTNRADELPYYSPPPPQLPPIPQPKPAPTEMHRRERREKLVLPSKDKLLDQHSPSRTPNPLDLPTISGPTPLSYPTPSSYPTSVPNLTAHSYPTPSRYPTPPPIPDLHDSPLPQPPLSDSPLTKPPIPDSLLPQHQLQHSPLPQTLLLDFLLPLPPLPDRTSAPYQIPPPNQQQNNSSSQQQPLYLAISKNLNTPYPKTCLLVDSPGPWTKVFSVKYNWVYRGFTCSGAPDGCLSEDQWCNTKRPKHCSETSSGLSTDKTFCQNHKFWDEVTCKDNNLYKCTGFNPGPDLKREHQ